MREPAHSPDALAPDPLAPGAMDCLTSSGAAAVAVAAGRLYRLGGYIALDGRISWAPEIPGRYTPHNNYVVIEDERAYLIDTGVAAHRATVVAQLKALLAPDLPLTAFLTRSEFACAGNLGAICSERGIEELVSSARNPFAASDEIAAELEGSVRRTNLDRGAVAPLGASKTLIVIPPLIRLLATYWVYDPISKTLFTSDLFGHVSVASPSDTPVIESLDQDSTTYHQVREHTLLRYHWLPIATTDTLVTWLRKVFDTYDIEIIAPTSGCVLKGRPLVEKHFDLIVELFERVPGEAD